MRLVGRVIFVSRNRGMVVVRHEDGFAVVEMMGSEGEVVAGDSVLGDWDAVGDEQMKAHGRNLDVYIQGNWGSMEAAIGVARKAGG